MPYVPGDTMTPRPLAARDARAPGLPAMPIRSSPSQRTGPSYTTRRTHENRNARWAPTRVAGRPIRKTEVLGLLIFVVMAAVTLAVGAALFYDWLAEPGSAPMGTPVELGPVSEFLSIAGAVPAVAIVMGVEVIGGLSLIALYMLSRAGRGA